MEFSGVGRTTGTAITLMIRNLNTRSGDCAKPPTCAPATPTTAYRQVRGFQGTAAARHSGASRRQALRQARSADGAERPGREVTPHIAGVQAVGRTAFQRCRWSCRPATRTLRCWMRQKRKAMQAAIRAAGSEGDGVGGILETIVTGLPAGIGEPWFDSVESELAHLMFAARRKGH